MKRNNLFALLFAFFAFSWANVGMAQYDDLYYNPDTDGDYYNSSSSSYTSNDYYDDNSSSGYDDDDYDYYDDYNYHYSSRIRRFHRPYYGFNYFDPVYVDVAYYDPFFAYDPFWTPGVSTLIYDPYWSANSWRRSRWNSGFGWNSWGGPSFFVSYNSFYNPWRSNWYNPWYGGNNFIVNNYYGGGYGGFGNSYYGGGYGGGYGS